MCLAAAHPKYFRFKSRDWIFHFIAFQFVLSDNFHPTLMLSADVSRDLYQPLGMLLSILITRVLCLYYGLFVL